MARSRADDRVFRQSLVCMMLGIMLGIAQQGTADAAAAQEGYVTGGAPDTFDTPPQGRGRRGRPVEGYYKGRITPHWFDDDGQFWYRNDLSDRSREFIRVDAEAGRRHKAFDHARLAAALGDAMGETVDPEKLPFDSIEFVNGLKQVRFAVNGSTWVCDLERYRCSKSDQEMSPSSSRSGSRRGRGGGRGRNRSVESPDGEWTAVVKDHNIFLRARGGDESQAIQLSTDGIEDRAYGVLSWSPDSQRLVGFRIEPGDRKEVHLLESSPAGGGRAQVHSRPYALPGDKFSHYELNLFDIDARKQTKPKVDRLELQWGSPRVRWTKQGRAFRYEHIDRGHQRLRIIEVNAESGRARNLVDEKTETFIWTAHAESLRLDRVNWMQETDEIIYASEQDGWRHLYLVNGEREPRMAQITKGPWVVGALISSTKKPARYGSTPRARTRTRIPTSSIPIGSTLTARVSSP